MNPDLAFLWVLAMFAAFTSVFAFIAEISNLQYSDFGMFYVFMMGVLCTAAIAIPVLS